MINKLIDFVDEQFSTLENTTKNKSFKEKLTKEAIENYHELKNIGYSDNESYDRTIEKLTTPQPGYMNIYALKNKIPYFSKFDLIPTALVLITILLLTNTQIINVNLDNKTSLYTLLAFDIFLILLPIFFDKKHRIATTIISLIVLTIFSFAYIKNPIFINSLPQTTIWLIVLDIIYYLQVRLPMKSIFGFLNNK